MKIWMGLPKIVKTILAKERSATQFPGSKAEEEHPERFAAGLLGVAANGLGTISRIALVYVQLRPTLQPREQSMTTPQVLHEEFAMDFQPNDSHLGKGLGDFSLGPNDYPRHVRAPHPRRMTTARLLAVGVMAMAPFAMASDFFAVTFGVVPRRRRAVRVNVKRKLYDIFPVLTQTTRRVTPESLLAL